MVRIPNEREVNKILLLLQKIETMLDIPNEKGKHLKILGYVRQIQEILNPKRKVLYYSLVRWANPSRMNRGWSYTYWRNKRMKHRRRWTRKAKKLYEF